MQIAGGSNITDEDMNEINISGKSRVNCFSRFPWLVQRGII